MMKPGFTLVEMTVVVALIALLCFLGFGFVSLFDRTLVNAELDKLYIVFVELQQRALVEHVPQQLIFDINNNSYKYNSNNTTQRTERLARGVQFGVIPGAKGPPSQPTKLLGNPSTFNNNTVIFYPDGIIEPGSIYITNKAHSVLYSLSSSVAQISYIRRYIFNESWCLLS